MKKLKYPENRNSIRKYCHWPPCIVWRMFLYISRLMPWGVKNTPVLIIIHPRRYHEILDIITELFKINIFFILKIFFIYLLLSTCKWCQLKFDRSQLIKVYAHTRQATIKFFFITRAFAMHLRKVKCCVTKHVQHNAYNFIYKTVYTCITIQVM